MLLNHREPPGYEQAGAVLRRLQVGISRVLSVFAGTGPGVLRANPTCALSRPKTDHHRQIPTVGVQLSADVRSADCARRESAVHADRRTHFESEISKKV